VTRALSVLMISSEVANLARTGGLGDVVDSLSAAMRDLGHHVIVVTPRYGITRMPASAQRWRTDLVVSVGGRRRRVAVLELPQTASTSGGTRRTCLVDDPELFERDGIYGAHGVSFLDNDVRFAVLSRAALAIGERAWGTPDRAGPDILHAHDWHATFGVIDAKTTMGPRFSHMPSVLTIHNLAYQGEFGASSLDRLGVPRALYTEDLLAHAGRANYMKGAITLADVVTTVSPRYAFEITTPEFGFGLDAHLRAHAGKVIGIVNGIDASAYDPAHDPALEHVYDASSWREGKPREKTRLQRLLGLDADPRAPLFAVVSRLAPQKGIDLVAGCASALVMEGAQLALMGEGEPEVARIVGDLGRLASGRVWAKVAFDDGLARAFYAASDFFVVPSRFEPCGLTQLYAMRYGSIPVVTRLGGLADTVTDADRRGLQGTGLFAERPSCEALASAFSRALALYRDRDAMARVIARGMAVDSSWARSARAYASLFDEAAERASGAAAPADVTRHGGANAIPEPTASGVRTSATIGVRSTG
jgi:starch synthase